MSISKGYCHNEFAVPKFVTTGYFIFSQPVLVPKQVNLVSYGPAENSHEYLMKMASIYQNKY